jgi:uncharacterized protein DUF551
MSRWIRADRRLPNSTELVLVYIPDAERKYELCRYDYGKWRYSPSMVLKDEVTHWQYLSTPKLTYPQQTRKEKFDKILLMIKRGHSLSEIASEVDFSPSYISLIRSGKRGPNSKR